MNKDTALVNYTALAKTNKALVYKNVQMCVDQLSDFLFKLVFFNNLS